MIAIIGDIHAHLGRLNRVLDHLAKLPDLAGVLLVGDVSWNPPWHERMAHIEAQRGSFVEVVDLIKARLPVPLAFVPGNHDPREIDRPENADRRVVNVAGWRVFGIGGAGPTRFGLPYEWDEAEIEALALPPCDIILSHTPPHGTPLDALRRGGAHVGSTAIRALAEAHDGLLVCGHIHEGAGFVVLGRCLCVNVGALGSPFGRAQVGLAVKGPAGWSVNLLDLGSGVAQASPPG